MTTVAQMIEWLQTLPQDAIVECLKEETPGYSSYTVSDKIDIESCDVFDYREDDYKTWHMHGKVIVVLKAE